MQILNRVTVVMCLLGVSGWAWAAPIPLSPGAWKMQMEIPGMPAQAAAMMARDMPEVCVRPGMSHPPLSPQAKARIKAMHCRILHESGSGTHWKATESCPAEGSRPALTVAMNMTVAPNHKSYVQKSRILQGPGAGMPTSTMRGTWVGPTCPPSSQAPLPAVPGES